MDGYVTIGTKLDTKQLEKDLDKAQRELLKLDSEAERLQEKKIFVELDLKDYYKAIEEVKENTDRDLYLYGKTDEQAQQILETEEETLRNIDEQYAKQLQKLSLINAKIKENADAQENMKGQIATLNEELGNTTGKFDVKGLKNNFNKIGTSIGGIVGKVIKWGLALLGVRTVLSILTRSFGTLSQYNDDLANKMDGLRLLLAVAFEPVITWLISALQKVMQIVGMIYKALTGIDIYARANELMAKKTAKSYGGMAKSAKEIRKQLAGFDEMNVLTDNVASSGGGASTSIPEIGELKATEEEVEKTKDKILGAFFGIGYWLKKIGIKGIINIVKNTGLWITTHIVSWIAGIHVKFIQFVTKLGEGIFNVATWIWTKLTNIALSIWDFIKGVFVSAKDFIWQVILVIGQHFTSLGDNVKNIFSKMWEFIKNVGTLIGQHFSNVWDGLKNGASTAWEKVKSIFSGITSFFGNIINNIIGFFKTIGTKVGDAIGGAFKSAINGVLKAVETILNAPIRAINGLIGAINKLPGVNFSKLSTFSLPRLAKGGIINQPGRGVMVGGAIGGESGKEGVIPLTDSQQMALLGQAIGKYITINANITNTMNGRVISRELQKINDESSFAFNR